ncbi:hypothetical protein MTO96_009473 [Rhipicephalus appendiculatus]
MNAHIPLSLRLQRAGANLGRGVPLLHSSLDPGVTSADEPPNIAAACSLGRVDRPAIVIGVMATRRPEFHPYAKVPAQTARHEGT